MQIRRGNIATILLAIALPVLFFLLPYRVEVVPNWVVYPLICICGLVIIGSILAFTPFWDKFSKKEPIQALSIDSDSIPSTNTYGSIVRITAQEPSKHAPIIIDIVLVICSLIILASGILIMCMAILDGVIPRDFDAGWLMFILLLIVSPIWILVDTIIFERKQRKLDRSRVAKEKTVDLYDKADAVFDRCLQAIVTWQSSIIAMNRPKLIKARWRNSIITVTVTNMAYGRVRVHTLSDSKWTTTKWDFGINQRNVDSLERLLQTKEQSLVQDKPLTLQIGESAFIASQPYTDGQKVKDVICRVILGNPNDKPKTVTTFRLEVRSKAPYPLSEARDSECGGSYLVPPGGGFSTVPRKQWLKTPVQIKEGEGVAGWIGFCLLQREDLSLAEAWKIEGKLVAVQADGNELHLSFPPCDLPRASSG